MVRLRIPEAAASASAASRTRPLVGSLGVSTFGSRARERSAAAPVIDLGGERAGPAPQLRAAVVAQAPALAQVGRPDHLQRARHDRSHTARGGPKGPQLQLPGATPGKLP